MTVTDQATVIRLEPACVDSSCAELAWQLHRKLDTPNYTRGVALMPCPDSLEQWQAHHRTARKRAWRAGRLGYRFAEVDMSSYADDRFAINVSLERRQGRPMEAGYRKRYQPSRLPDYSCARHKIHTYGVLQDDGLRAYLTLYRVGDLALVSMILGHGDHLRNDVMYLLAAGMVEAHAGEGCWFYYNRWDSGTDGLRFYKERIGFREADVEWAL
jgi:hypothetical protein